MSVNRWMTTCLGMAGAAWLLVALGPGAAELRHAATAPQVLVDTAGPDALLLVVAGAAGWLCWAWGALGLLLTGLSALPGVAGRSAGLLLVVLVPAGARRAAALAVGLSVAAGSPALAATAPAGATAPSLVVADAATAAPGAAAADWPVAEPGGAAAGLGPPDWPTGSPAPPPTAHVVVRGDCLWDIAADRLVREHPGAPVGDADVAAAVRAWWLANAPVIGPDPDLLLPGQVLQAPVGSAPATPPSAFDVPGGSP